MVLIRVASLFLKIAPIPALRPDHCPQFEPPGFRPEHMDFVAHLGQSGHFGMSKAFPSPFRGSKRAPEAFSEADALPRPAPCAAAWRPGRGLKRPVRLCGHKKTPPPGNPGSRESEIYNYFPASFLYMARRAAASSSFFLNRLAAASGNCLSRLA